MIAIHNSTTDGLVVEVMNQRPFISKNPCLLIGEKRTSFIFIPNTEVIFLEDSSSQIMSIIIPKCSSAGVLNQEEESVGVYV